MFGLIEVKSTPKWKGKEGYWVFGAIRKHFLGFYSVTLPKSSGFCREMTPEAGRIGVVGAKGFWSAVLGRLLGLGR